MPVMTASSRGNASSRPGPAPAAGDEARWSAVFVRDGGMDGKFVYAVRTTGVYCRPSCPSRRPRREHVSFYANPDTAEAAGFRACRRCHPRQAITSMQLAADKARAFLEAHLEQTVTLDALGRAVGMSPHHLQRTFKRVVGVSPKRYVAALRADRMKRELRRGSTVSRATYEAGYGASSRLYDVADQQLGMTPAAYRRGGQGVHIRYVTSGTTLGRVLVAATARGVCAITLGDDDSELEGALRAEYPKATLERVALAGTTSDDQLRKWTEAVVRHLSGKHERLVIPTDAAGTPFQQRVWRELRSIPAGETRSYTDIAVAIGSPNAARAVASACATNRVALVVPCHRVVQRSGTLGGYRWGVDRKRRLLEGERADVAHRVQRVTSVQRA